jgi:hypothetical protein
MTMTDLYLRFTDQPEAIAVLQPLDMTYTDEEGVEQISQGSHQFALSIVGEIPSLTGYHLNIRQIDESMNLSSLDSYRVYPPYPVCVWA